MLSMQLNLIFFTYSLLQLTSASNALSSKLEARSESSHLELSPLSSSCGGDIEIFLSIDEKCPQPNETIDVSKKPGNLAISNWAEGTGSWKEFEEFFSSEEIYFHQGGKHKVSVCFHTANNLSFKSVLIGNEMGGPKGSKPFVFPALDYVSFVDNDMTSNGLPTIVKENAIGYISSGESLDYEIDVRYPGSYNVAYKLSRSCDSLVEPEIPVKCTNGGVKCGNNGNCCEADERCYVHSYFTDRELFSGVTTYNLNVEGTCCPMLLSCGHGCCPEGHTCVEGSCKSIRITQSEYPVCKKSEYNCGSDSCCSKGEDCYVEGISGPINRRSLSYDSRKLDEGSCCPKSRSCDLECCSEDAVCVKGSCKLKGCSPDRSCGDECCEPGELCVNDTCYDKDIVKTEGPMMAPVFDGRKARKIWSGEKYTI